jgi:hypothetical protein
METSQIAADFADRKGNINGLYNNVDLRTIWDHCPDDEKYKFFTEYSHEVINVAKSVFL